MFTSLAEKRVAKQVSSFFALTILHCQVAFINKFLSSPKVQPAASCLTDIITSRQSKADIGIGHIFVTNWITVSYIILPVSSYARSQLKPFSFSLYFQII